MFRKSKTIYLDHAAGTSIDPAVFAAMKPYLTESYANPSALYSSAVEAKKAIEGARKTVASFLQATEDSIVFTRGGTHSINIALVGAALKHKTIGKHIITTAIEHSAVLNTLQQLEKEGFDVTYLPVDEFGFVTVQQVNDAIREDTILVSVMYANNEIGTIEPIADIGRMLLQHRKKQNTVYPLFHTDACQAAGSLDMSVERLHVDLLSFNGSKIYGPKGVGILYKRRGVGLEPVWFGGGQEFGLSPGTEDVAGIVGIATAVVQIIDHKTWNNVVDMRNYLWRNIQTTIEDVLLNGPELDRKFPLLSKEGSKGRYRRREDGGSPSTPPDLPLSGGGTLLHRLPNNLNVSFLGADSEALILYLDAKKIQVSSGSACTADSNEVSHVLKACGYDEERMKSSIRFSLGKDTAKRDVDYVLKVLPTVVQRVRGLSSV